MFCFIYSYFLLPLCHNETLRETIFMKIHFRYEFIFMQIKLSSYGDSFSNRGKGRMAFCFRLTCVISL